MDEIEKNRLERALALIRQILPLVEAAEKNSKARATGDFLICSVEERSLTL